MQARVSTEEKRKRDRITNLLFELEEKQLKWFGHKKKKKDIPSIMRRTFELQFQWKGPVG
jgi:hypothetical protein